MDIIAVWFSKVSKTVELSSDEESRTWKALLKNGEFSLRVWVDFSKINIQYGEETRTFNFDSDLRGIPDETDSDLKKERIRSRSFFWILIALLLNLEVLEERSFKTFLRRTLRDNIDEYGFLCESLIAIETGIDIIVSKDRGIGILPNGNILVVLNGGTFAVVENHNTTCKIWSSETVFSFIHWVLKETCPLKVFWKKAGLEDYWKNLSPSVNTYSARYRIRFETAIAGLVRLETPSFEIPDIRPRGFVLEVKVHETTHVVMCFALAEFRIKGVIRDEKHVLMIW